MRPSLCGLVALLFAAAAAAAPCGVHVLRPASAPGTVLHPVTDAGDDRGRLHPQGSPTVFSIPLDGVTLPAVTNTSDVVLDFDLFVYNAIFPVVAVSLLDGDGDTVAVHKVTQPAFHLRQTLGEFERVKRVVVPMVVLPAAGLSVTHVELSLDGSTPLPFGLEYILTGVNLRVDCPSCGVDPFGFHGDAALVPFLPTGTTVNVATTGTRVPPAGGVDMSPAVSPRSHRVDADGAALAFHVVNQLHPVTGFSIIGGDGTNLYTDASVPAGLQTRGGGDVVVALQASGWHAGGVDPDAFRAAHIVFHRHLEGAANGPIVSDVRLVVADTRSNGGGGRPLVVYPLVEPATTVTVGHPVVPLPYTVFSTRLPASGDLDAKFEVDYDNVTRACPITAVRVLSGGGSPIATIPVNRHAQWATGFTPAGLSMECSDAASNLAGAAALEFVMEEECRGELPPAAGFTLRGFGLGVPFDPLSYPEGCGTLSRDHDMNSAFQAPVPHEFFYCRQCCCRWATPCAGKELAPTSYCLSAGQPLSEVMHCAAEQVNAQCQHCLPDVNKDIRLPPPGNQTCDDGVACSHSDRCQGLFCVGDLQDKAKCLADASLGPICEDCDGDGGCAVLPGHFVTEPYPHPNRTCACVVDGVKVPHGALSPASPCLYCNVYESSTAWSLRSNGAQCEPTLDYNWWRNLFPQACAGPYTCLDGACQQAPAYSCPAAPACAAINPLLQRQCNHRGLDDESFGCELDTREEGYVCKPRVNGCMEAVTCGGALKACPAYTRRPGTVYLTSNTTVDVVHPDGAPLVDGRRFVVADSLLGAAFTNWFVQCGKLGVLWGVVFDGECRLDRAAGAWAVRHTMDAGSVTLRSAEASVWGSDGTHVLAGAGGLPEVAVTFDGDLSAFVDPKCDCVHGALLGFEFRHDLPEHPLRSVEVVDGGGRALSAIVVHEDQARGIGAWAATSVHLPTATMAEFDWGRVAGVRFHRSGLLHPVPVDVPLLRTTVRNIAFQRDYVPPCPVAVVTPPDVTLVGTVLDANTAQLDLEAGVDLAAAVANLGAGTLVFDWLLLPDVPLPGAITLYPSVDGVAYGVRVPLPPPQSSTPTAFATEVTTYRVPLNPFMVNVSIAYAGHYDAVDRVAVEFLDNLPPPPAIPFALRGLRVVNGSAAEDAGGCRGRGTVMTEGAPAVMWQAGTKGGAVDLVANATSGLFHLPGLPRFEFLDLPAAYIDAVPFVEESCSCLRGAELVVRASFSSPEAVPDVIRVVDGARRGVEVDVDRLWVVGRHQVQYGMGHEVVLRFPLDATTVTDPLVDASVYVDLAKVFFEAREEAGGVADGLAPVMRLRYVGLERAELQCFDQFEAITGDGSAETLRLSPDLQRVFVWPGSPRLSATVYPPQPADVALTDVVFVEALEGVGAAAVAPVDVHATVDRVVAVARGGGQYLIGGDDFGVVSTDPAGSLIVALDAAGTLAYAGVVAVGNASTAVTQSSTSANGAFVVVAGWAGAGAGVGGDAPLCAAGVCGGGDAFPEGGGGFVGVLDAGTGAPVMVRATGGSVHPVAAVSASSVGVGVGDTVHLGSLSGAFPWQSTVLGCTIGRAASPTVRGVLTVPGTTSVVVALAVEEPNACVTPDTLLPSLPPHRGLACVARLDFNVSSGAASTAWWHCMDEAASFVPDVVSPVAAAGECCGFVVHGTTSGDAAWVASSSTLDVAGAPTQPDDVHFTEPHAAWLAAFGMDGALRWVNHVVNLEAGHMRSLTVSAAGVVGLGAHGGGHVAAAVGGGDSPPGPPRVPLVMEFDAVTGAATRMAKVISRFNVDGAQPSAVGASPVSSEVWLTGWSTQRLLTHDTASTFSPPWTPVATSPNKTWLGLVSVPTTVPAGNRVAGVPGRLAPPLGVGVATAVLAPTVDTALLLGVDGGLRHVAVNGAVADVAAGAAVRAVATWGQQFVLGGSKAGRGWLAVHDAHTAAHEAEITFIGHTPFQNFTVDVASVVGLGRGQVLAAETVKAVADCGELQAYPDLLTRRGVVPPCGTSTVLHVAAVVGGALVDTPVELWMAPSPPGGSIVVADMATDASFGVVAVAVNTHGVERVVWPSSRATDTPLVSSGGDGGAAVALLTVPSYRPLWVSGLLPNTTLLHAVVSPAGVVVCGEQDGAVWVAAFGAGGARLWEHDFAAAGVSCADLTEAESGVVVLLSAEGDVGVGGGDALGVPDVCGSAAVLVAINYEGAIVNHGVVGTAHVDGACGVTPVGVARSVDGALLKVLASAAGTLSLWMRNATSADGALPAGLPLVVDMEEGFGAVFVDALELFKVVQPQVATEPITDARLEAAAVLVPTGGWGVVSAVAATEEWVVQGGAFNDTLVFDGGEGVEGAGGYIAVHSGATRELLVADVVEGGTPSGAAAAPHGDVYVSAGAGGLLHITRRGVRSGDTSPRVAAVALPPSLEGAAVGDVAVVSDDGGGRHVLALAGSNDDRCWVASVVVDGGVIDGDAVVVGLDGEVCGVGALAAAEGYVLGVGSFGGASLLERGSGVEVNGAHANVSTGWAAAWAAGDDGLHPGAVWAQAVTGSGGVELAGVAVVSTGATEPPLVTVVGTFWGPDAAVSGTGLTSTAPATGFAATLWLETGAVHTTMTPAVDGHGASYGVDVAASPTGDAVVVWSAPPNTHFPPLAGVAPHAGRRRAVAVLYPSADLHVAASVLVAGGTSPSMTDATGVAVGVDGALVVGGAAHAPGDALASGVIPGSARSSYPWTPPSVFPGHSPSMRPLVQVGRVSKYGLLSTPHIRRLATHVAAPPSGVTPSGCSHVAVLTDVVVCSMQVGAMGRVVATSRTNGLPVWSHEVEGSVVATAAASDAGSVFVAARIEVVGDVTPAATFALPGSLRVGSSAVLFEIHGNGGVAFARQIHSSYDTVPLAVGTLAVADDTVVIGGSTPGDPTFGDFRVSSGTPRATFPAPHRCFVLTVSTSGFATAGTVFGSKSPGALCAINAAAATVWTTGAVAYVGGEVSLPAAAAAVAAGEEPDEAVPDSAPPVWGEALRRGTMGIGFVSRVDGLGQPGMHVATSTLINDDMAGGEAPPVGAVVGIVAPTLATSQEDLHVYAAAVVGSACWVGRLEDTTPVGTGGHITASFPVAWQRHLAAGGGGGVVCNGLTSAGSGPTAQDLAVAATVTSSQTLVAHGVGGPADAQDSLWLGPAAPDATGGGLAVLALNGASGTLRDHTVAASKYVGVGSTTHAAGVATTGRSLDVYVGVVAAAPHAKDAPVDRVPFLRPAWRGGRLRVDTRRPLVGVIRYQSPAVEPQRVPTPLLSTHADTSRVLDPTSVHRVVQGYRVVVDARANTPGHRLAGGFFRHGDGTGPGFNFTFEAEDVEGMVVGEWSTLSAPVTAANNFILDGTLSAWRALHTFVLLQGGAVDPGSADPGAYIDVRNVMLVKDTATCRVGCGVLQVLEGSHAFAEDGGWGGLLTPTTAFSADLSALMNRPCRCLEGARLDLRVVASPGCDPSAVVLSSDATLAANVTVPVEAAGGDRRAFSGVVARRHHSRVANLDWTAVSVMGLVVDAATCVFGSATVSDFKVSARCARLDAAFAPNASSVDLAVVTNTSVGGVTTLRVPDGEGNAFGDTRAGFDLIHGAAYKVIAVGRNVWGGTSNPVCSPAFTVDRTPPDVANVTAVDLVSAIDHSQNVDVGYSQDRTLTVGWVGAASEPDTGPLVDYFIHDVLFAVNGSSVPGAITTAHPKELSEAVGRAGLDPPQPGVVFTSDAVVATVEGEPHLVQGVEYVPVLGVRNFAKGLSTVATNGVVLDWTPPERVLLEAVDGEGGVITATTSQTVLHAVWEFGDPHTGVHEVYVGVGSSPAGADVVPLALVGAASREAFAIPGDYFVGQGYHIIARVSNPAGVVATFASAAVYVDPSPPAVQYVISIDPGADAGNPDPDVGMEWFTDGPTGDIPIHSGTGVFKAKWKCLDLESVRGGERGEMAYAWRLCGSEACAGGGGDAAAVTPWMEVGGDRQGATPGGIAAEGVHDFVWVVMACTNPAGLTSVGVSNAVNITLAPPDASLAVVTAVSPACVLAGDGCADVVRFSAIDMLGVTWTGFRALPGSPISTYQVQLLRGDTLVQTTVVDKSQDAVVVTVANMTAAQGQEHVWRVVAVASGGEAGKPSEVVVVDAVPTRVDRLHAVYGGSCPHEACMPPAEGDGVEAQVAGEEVALRYELFGATPTRCQWGLNLCNMERDSTALPYALQAEGDVADMVGVDVKGTALAEGVHMCFTMQCLTVTGLESVTETRFTPGPVMPFAPPHNLLRSVVKDSSPPAFTDAHIGHRRGWHTAFTANDTVTVWFTCGDDTSGVLRVEAELFERVGDGEVSVGVVVKEAPGGVDTIAVPGLATQYTPQNNATYRVAVACVNGASLGVVRWTQAVGLDLTPPVGSSAAVDVQDGADVLHVAAYPSLAWSDGTSITATWAGFRDEESTLVGFSWAVGTSPGGGDVVPLTHVGPTAYATADGLQIAAGLHVFVTVVAHNAAGLDTYVTSPEVVVDPTAPGSEDAEVAVEGVVAGYLPVHAVNVSWAGVADTETLTRLSVGVGAAPFAAHAFTEVVIDAGTPGGATVVDVPLHPGDMYWATVVATNPAGLSLVTSSPPFVYDPEPPRAVFVHVGTSPNSNLALTLYAASALDCMWLFEDPISPVTAYTVALVGGGGGAMVATAEVAAEGTGVHRHRFPLGVVDAVTPGLWHCVVTAHDASGLSSPGVASPGTTVDGTPPDAGDVLDGTLRGLDVDLVPPGTQDVGVTWSGWQDDVLGLSSVLWGVGTSPGADNLLAFTDVHPALGFARRRLGRPLTSGMAVYSTLIAHNGLASTTASTDGFVVQAALSDVAADAVVVSIPMTDTENRTACGCHGEFGGWEARPQFHAGLGACVCPPGAFLTRAGCTSCPPGTCKPTWGNGMLACSAAACGVNMTVESLPGAAPWPTSGQPCDGNDALKRVVGGVCACPPGYLASADGDGPCVLCPSGTWNGGPGVGAGACSVCAPREASPQAVLDVEWEAEGVEGADIAVVDRLVVGVGLADTAASVWEFPVAPVGMGIGADGRSGRASLDLAAAWPPTGALLHVAVSAWVTTVLTFTAEAPSLLAVDFTPPLAGGVALGEDTDATVWPSASQATVAWDASTWREPDGEIVGYRVALGYAPDADDVSGGWAVVDGGAESHAFEGLAMEPLRVVYATLVAVNAAGAWSIPAHSGGAVVEPDLPGGVVVVHHTQDVVLGANSSAVPFPHAAVQPTTGSVTAVWRFGDSARRYTYTWQVWAAGGDGAWRPLNNATDVGGELAATLEGVVLAPGDRVRVEVLCANAAGVSASAVSLDTVVDPSAPSNGTLAWAGEDLVEFGGVVYQRGGAAVAVDVAFLDDESGALAADLAVGTSAGGQQVGHIADLALEGGLGWASAVWASPRVNLSDGDCVYATAVGVNPAGLWSPAATSDARLCVDGSPPDVGGVEWQLLDGGGEPVATSDACGGMTKWVQEPAQVRVLGVAHEPHSVLVGARWEAVDMGGVVLAGGSVAEAVHPDTGAFNVTLDWPTFWEEVWEVHEEEREVAVFVPTGGGTWNETAGGNSSVLTNETAGGNSSVPTNETAGGNSSVPTNETAGGNSSAPTNETAGGNSSVPTNETAGGNSSVPTNATSGYYITVVERYNVTNSSIVRADIHARPLTIRIVAENVFGEPVTSTAPVFFVVDDSPPACGVAAPAWVAPNTTYSTEWSVDDTGSPITATNVTIADGSLLPLPTYVQAFTQTAPEFGAHGAALGFGVRSCNAAGLCCEASGTTVVDATPPVSGVLSLSHPAAGTLYWPSQQQFVAQEFLSLSVVNGTNAMLSWAGFTDGESGVAHFEVMVGTTPHGSQLQAPFGARALPASTTAVALKSITTVAPLPHQPIFVTVTCVSGVGLRTTAAAQVAVVDADQALGGDWLAAALTVDVPEQEQGGQAGQQVVQSQAQLLQAQLLQLQTPVVDDAGVSESQWHLSPGSHLPTGVWTPTAASPAVRVGWPAALPAGVSGVVELVQDDDGVVLASAHVPAGTTALSHVFTGVTLPPGAAVRGRMVLSSPTVDAALPTANLVVLDATPPQLPGAVTAGLATHVHATCAASHATPADVDVSLPVVLSTPLARQVSVKPFDVPDAEAALEGDLPPFAVLAARWPQWVDPQSGVVESVEVAVGFTGAPTALSPFQAVPGGGGVTSVQVLLPPLPVGAPVIVSVRATNGLGLVAEAVATPPSRVVCVAPYDQGCDVEDAVACV